MVGLTASVLPTIGVAGAVAVAAGYLAWRVIRLLKPGGASGGCGVAGSRCCPAAAAADGLREAARRAARRFPASPEGS